LKENLLPHLPIASPVTNGNVLLSQVGSIEARPGTPELNRENQRLMVRVTASLAFPQASTSSLTEISSPLPRPPDYCRPLLVRRSCFS
jgi:multidrug efflux pump subunit AcrB